MQRAKQLRQPAGESCSPGRGQFNKMNCKSMHTNIFMLCEDKMGYLYQILGD